MPLRQFIGLIFVILSGLLLRDALSSGQILGESYAAARSMWGVWFPWHAMQHNLDMAFTNYLAFPQETNITLLLSPISTLLYHLLDVILPAVAGLQSTLSTLPDADRVADVPFCTPIHPT